MHSQQTRAGRTRGFQMSLRLKLVGAGAAAVAVVAITSALAVTGSNTITTVAGNGEPGFSGDGGPATAAKIYAPAALAFDVQGNMYIADPGDPNPNDRVRKVTPGGTITTFAGGGDVPGPGIGDGGPATLAELNVPEGVAVDGAGNVYIADRNNGRIRKVNTAGIITTFAGGGNPIPPDVGDGGPATSARVALPDGVAVDGSGNVYIADRDQMRVRKVNAAGIITTIAGNGTQGDGGDGGPATSAQLRFPHGLAVDALGNVYIADYANQRVRKVSTAGIITTVAGTGAICSPNFVCGDGGPATSATLQSPTGVALDAQGSLYIVMASRVRKVDSAGIITTITSAHDPGPYPGDGLPAIVAKTFGPYGVAVDGQGSLYIAEAYGSRVRKVDVGSQSSGTITFDPLAPKTYGDPDFTVSATASTGLTVSFSASGNCTVSGTIVHITGAGSCTITASQSGDVRQPGGTERQPHVRDREGEPDDHVRGAREQEARRSRLHGQRAGIVRTGCRIRRARLVHRRWCACAPHRRGLLHDHSEPGRQRELRRRARSRANLLDRSQRTAAPLQGAESDLEDAAGRQVDDYKEAMPDRQGDPRVLANQAQRDRDRTEPAARPGAASELEDRPRRQQGSPALTRECRSAAHLAKTVTVE